jgi:hypothetical protein
LRGGVPRYVAQAIPQIDAEIAEKGHLWMETRLTGSKSSLVQSPKGQSL